MPFNQFEFCSLQSTFTFSLPTMQQSKKKKNRKLIWRKGSNGRNIDKDYNAQTCPNHLRSSQIHSCFWSNGFGKCSSHMSDVFCSAFSFSSLKTWPQLKGSTTEGIHDLSDACYTVTPKYTKVYADANICKHICKVSDALRLCCYSFGLVICASGHAACHLQQWSRSVGSSLLQFPEPHAQFREKTWGRWEAVKIGKAGA